METPDEKTGGATMPSTSIKLKSSDNVIFEVDVEVAKYSKVIKTMLDECNVKVGQNDVVPLPEVRSTVLEKIIIWGEYQKRHPYHLWEEYTPPFCNMRRWEEKFLKENKDILVELISAANYLDIEKLKQISCQMIGNFFKDKNVVEARRIFQIPEEDEEDSDQT